jgi:hypothetical protein
MQKLIAYLLIGFLPTPLLAQQSATKEAEGLSMVHWMVGRWEGESWLEFEPGQRKINHALESVQSRVGDAVLLIEGYHKGKIAGEAEKAEDVVIHDLIRILLYDSKAKRYRFVAYTARQGYGDFQAKLADGGWGWEMTTPSGSVRFTITHTDKDEWSEKGEASPDGKTWRQFFGMTLHRVE